MSGQSMKVDLKILNLPDETINDIQTEGELEEIVSAMMTKMKQRCENKVKFKVCLK